MLDEVALGGGLVTFGNLDMAFADVPEGKCALAIMGKPGDVKIIWDKTKSAEVEVARKNFNELRAAGYAAFSVGDKGEKKETEHITVFDPNVERMILALPLVGG